MTKPAITQAMIDAYDEYTHLTLDRRGFMEKLTKLAGSGAAAAAIAPMLAANPAQAEIVAGRRCAAEGRGHHLARRRRRDEGLSRPPGRPERQAADGHRHPREPRAERAHHATWRGAWRWKASWRWRRTILSPLGGTPADEDKAREMIGAARRRRRRSANGVATVAFLEGHEPATARSARSASAGAAAR